MVKLEHGYTCEDIKLKPCPFCGSDNIAFDMIEGGIEIYCRECHIWFSGGGRSEEECAEAWNRRAAG